ANTDYVAFAHAVSTGTSLKVTGLTQGVEYTFRVAAKNIAGQGAYSADTLDAIATARTVPGAPTATASPTRDGAIQLEWNFVGSETDGGSEIDRYDVEWAKVGESTWSSAPYSYRTTLIKGLTIGTQYKFRTTATNAAGTGKYSQEVIATPQVPPKSVTNLTSLLTNSNGDQRLKLSWVAPLDTGGAALTQYYLSYCKTTSNECDSLPTVSPRNNVLATTITFNVQPGSYRYYVSAVNTVGVEKCVDEYRCGTSIPVVVPTP
ncbi:MAG: fibronectin type III domain-containing protein, partial [Actinobacteria bacterium]|nr:fibronectin type III domain-containing protein [Actinomycetota bacterium]